MYRQLMLCAILLGFVSTAVAQTDSLDFGRVRYYFTAGTTLSKSKDNFQRADLHIAFNMDKNWWRGDRINVNSFFDARLTSIPVAPGAGDGSENSSSATPGTSGFATAQFAESHKAALMQIGVYVPIRVSSWGGNQTGHYELFVAPIGKGGIQTITGEAVSAEAATLGGDDLFNYGAFGVRLGHHRIVDTEAGKLDPNEAPQIISYFEAVYGRWENFEICEEPVSVSGTTHLRRLACPDSSLDGTNIRRVRPYRWGFEGRLKLPALPLFIGFDANAGKGPDDLRFLFGTRFDIGELVKALNRGR